MDFTKIEINILEAVIDDIISNKKIPNAILGVNVMLLLPIMKEIQIIDCEGFNPFTPIIVKNNQKWLFFTKA
jgi:hypothetical protein